MTAPARRRDRAADRSEPGFPPSADLSDLMLAQIAEIEPAEQSGSDETQ